MVSDVARLIDADDLIDAGTVAQLLGLSSRNAVSVYRSRYSDFPAPVVNRGTCVLWLRADLDAWAKSSGRAPKGS